MNVTLSLELEKLIEEKVARGQYPSRDAVVQAALELFREQEEAAERRLEALIEDADNDDEPLELTAEVRSDIEKRAIAALRAKKPA